MMRALWTAASGMLSQQTNLDTISNNLSNINTVGFKKEANEFKSLLYQTLKENSYDSEGNPKAIGIQVGSGVRNSAITTQFTQGNLTPSESQFDLAIEGKGFFMVRTSDGSTAYTRNGHFTTSVGLTGMVLSNSDGYPVLSDKGMDITLDKSWDMSEINVNEVGQVVRERTTVQVNDAGGKLVQLEDAAGNIINAQGVITTPEANNRRLHPAAGTEAPEYKLVETTTYDVIAQIGLAQFNNPSGLTKSGGSLFLESYASGLPRIETEDLGVKKSKVHAKYLEASSVQAMDEMVNMIVAQRAYELNSKAITASDEMLQQANGLRR